MIMGSRRRQKEPQNSKRKLVHFRFFRGGIILSEVTLILCLLSTPGITMLESPHDNIIGSANSPEEVEPGAAHDLVPLGQSNTVRNSGNLHHAPRELIIKFKDDAVIGAVVQDLFEAGKTFESVTDDPQLDELCEIYQVKEFDRVFAELLGETTAVSPLALNNSVASSLHAEIRLKYKQRIERIRKTLNRPSSTMGDEVPYLGSVYRVRVDTYEDIVDVCNHLEGDPNVEYAQPNHLISLSFTPNDPFFSSAGSWGQPYEDLWALRHINMESAWDISGGNGVIIAVVDTGLDYNHGDIAANVWNNVGDIPGNGIDDDGNGFVDDVRGWDFANPGNDPIDLNGHGTHVAGTIAALGDNNVGVVGVAFQAQIMPVKGLNDDGNGLSSDLANALIYAAENGADIINNSWACSGPCPSNPVVEDAVRFAYGLGVASIFAAGNNSADVVDFSPQNMPETIVVSAVTKTDTSASFTNFGQDIDVSAPGAATDSSPPSFDPFRAILSLKSADAKPNFTGNGQLVVSTDYVRQAGTSMAAPHVSGLAGLILAQDPSLSVEQVRQVLRHSGDDIGAVGYDTDLGYGRINALSALSEPTPLEALITQPTFQVISDATTVEVRGLANGPGFENWTLEFASELTPTAWNLITTSGSAVTTFNGLLTNWDISGISDSTYILRLTVQNLSGAAFVDRQVITIDKVFITDPPEDTMDFFRSGENVLIQGTVNSANFSSYTVEIFDGATPVTDAAITLENGGVQPVINGLIATWDTNSIAAGHYRIVLIVTLTDSSTIVEETTVVVDPTLHPGWPINFGQITFGSFAFALVDHLIVADINNDSTEDILIGFGDSVKILNHDGQDITGWPQLITTVISTDTIQVSPVVGDVNGDSFPDVVAVTNNGVLYVWNSDGSMMPGFPKSSIGGALFRLALGDLDGNGSEEILIANGNSLGSVSVFDGLGNSFPGWPLTLSGGALYAPAVADVDGDGTKEIAVIEATGPSRLFLIRSNGSVMPGWPREINPALANNFSGSSYAVFGDLDGDVDLEIIVGGNDGNVNAFHHDGTTVPGWPVFTKATELNSPTAADLNGDGSHEVIIGTDEILEGTFQNNYLYVIQGDGTILPGWPVSVAGATSFGFGPTASADVDDDGNVDLIVSKPELDFSSGLRYGLTIYSQNGTELAGFPRPTADNGAFSFGSVGIADIDGDGLLEIAWVDFLNNLYLWDTISPADAPQPWPMFQRDSGRSGAGSIDPGENQVPIADAGPDQVVVDADDDGSEEVTLDASGSIDLDGAIVDYEWREGATVLYSGTSEIANVTFDLGIHNITLVVRDDENALGSDTMTVLVITQGINQFSTQISASSDDAEEDIEFGGDGDGDVELTNDNVLLGRAPSFGNLVGFRFRLDVPAGATIQNAIMQFTATVSNPAFIEPLVITGEATDDAQSFTTVPHNISSRPTTTASANWTIPAWDVGESGPDQQTSDLSGIVQEVIDRPGWAVGNYVSLIINPSANTEFTQADSYDRDPNSAVRLIVDYTFEGGNQLPVADAGADQTVTDSDQNGSETVILDGSASFDPDGAIVSYDWSEGGSSIATGVNPSVVLDVGVHTISLTVTDDNGGADTSTIEVTVNAGGGSNVVLDVGIAASSDDAEEDTGGNISLTSSDLEMFINNGSDLNAHVGLRFIADIPRGAVITDAYIQFTVDETGNEATSALIEGQAVDNALGFTSTDGNISSRERTTASVSWNDIPPWTSTGTSGPDQRTPDLSPIMQEIVDRTGWATNNALVIILSGTPGAAIQRVAESYDGTAPAVLHVEYTTGGGGNQLPVADAGADQTVTDNDQNGSETVILDGSASFDPDGAIVSYDWSEGGSSIATGVNPSVVLDVGVHTISLTVTDDDGGADTSTVEVTVNAGGGSNVVLDVGIAASSDDAEEDTGGNISLTSSDLEMFINNGSDQNAHVGLRFIAGIPRGAVITDAYIQFTVDETGSEATSALIEGEAVDNALGFTSTDGNISSRERTTASVSWNDIPPWTSTGTSGPDQRTPDLSPIMQEIVDRTGWATNNALVIILSGTPGAAIQRVAESFDGTAPAVLHIEYTTGGGGNQLPVADAGADQTVTDNDQNGSETVILDGSASFDPDGAIVSYDWSEGGSSIATGVNPSVVLDVGVHTISLTVTDDDGGTDTSTVLVTVNAGGVTTVILDIEIAASSDDAEEDTSGDMSLTSSDLEMFINNGSDQNAHVGLRFIADIPRGAVITDAYIQFTVDETGSEATSALIEGQAVDDALGFTSTDGNISSRERTTNSVSWNDIPPWTSTGTSGPDQRTPDLSPIMQEIVDRTGWATNNALVIILSGTPGAAIQRVAESYDGTAPAVLHVEYNTP